MGSLAKNIKRFRLANDLHQEELAQKIGVSQRAVSGYEMGTLVPSVLVLAQLAKVFDCSMDDLVK